MDYVLMILAIILALVGLVGAVIPGIAGPPFSWLAVLASYFISGVDYSIGFMVVTALIAVGITLLDYVVPVWGTKRFGGTKAGVRGSTIGLIIGLVAAFLVPFVRVLGVLLGPFVGAYIGEKIAGTPDNKAWRSAFGSFLGFLAGTLVKVVFALVMIYYVIKEIW